MILSWRAFKMENLCFPFNTILSFFFQLICFTFPTIHSFIWLNMLLYFAYGIQLWQLLLIQRMPVLWAWNQGLYCTFPSWLVFLNLTLTDLQSLFWRLHIFLQFASVNHQPYLFFHLLFFFFFYEVLYSWISIEKKADLLSFFINQSKIIIWHEYVLSVGIFENLNHR